MLPALLSKFGSRQLVKSTSAPPLHSVLQNAGVKKPARYLSATSNFAEKLLNSNDKEMQIWGEKYPVDHMTNITPAVFDLMERKLHLVQNNPVNLVKQRVYDYFQRNHVNENGDPLFATFDDFSPVTAEQSFDHLLMPRDHYNRSEIETYYLNKDTILRGVTSVHMSDMIARGYDRYLCTGDVYRRSLYDQTHALVFHLMDMQRLFTKQELSRTSSNANLEIFETGARDSKMETERRQLVHTKEAVELVLGDMKKMIKGVIESLLGHGVECQWNNYYCQFGRPYYDMRVLYQGEWLDVFVGGVLRQEIADKAGATDKIGWNCRLALDRIAMILYKIPDIRLLSSKNGKFASLFASLDKDPNPDVSKHCDASVCPIAREVVFLVPRDTDIAVFQYHFYELVRLVAEDDVQKVKLVDHFQHPKSGIAIQRYHITYMSWDRVLSETEVNCHHDIIKELAVSKFKVKVE